MKKQEQYKRPKDWFFAVKRDLNKFRIATQKNTFSPELFLVQIANLILLYLFVTLILKTLGLDNVFKNSSYLSIFITVAFEGVPRILKGEGLEILQRFKPTELLKFEISASYKIYAYLLVLNMIVIVSFFFTDIQIYAKKIIYKYRKT